MPGHDGVQFRYALNSLRQAGGCELAALLVLHLDIVVILGPVVTDEQHQHPPLRPRPVMMRSPRKARLAP
ncbi:hypothetical protein AR457_35910 [Streptomyces agglomeratus]|nr:hypothetical protein AR457_35910 [Streptomyces agglomeratus]